MRLSVAERPMLLRAFLFYLFLRVLLDLQSEGDLRMTDWYLRTSAGSPDCSSRRWNFKISSADFQSC